MKVETIFRFQSKILKFKFYTNYYNYGTCKNNTFTALFTKYKKNSFNAKEAKLQ